MKINRVIRKIARQVHADMKVLRENEDAHPTDRILLPCPIPSCRGDACYVYIEKGENAGGECIECGKCGLTTRVWFPLEDDVQELVIDAWNNRYAFPSRPQSRKEEKA